MTYESKILSVPLKIMVPISAIKKHKTIDKIASEFGANSNQMITRKKKLLKSSTKINSDRKSQS